MSRDSVSWENAVGNRYISGTSDMVQDLDAGDVVVGVEDDYPGVIKDSKASVSGSNRFFGIRVLPSDAGTGLNKHLVNKSVGQDVLVTPVNDYYKLDAETTSNPEVLDKPSNSDTTIGDLQL